MTAAKPEFSRWQRWFVCLSGWLPHHLIAAAMYRASQWRWPLWKNFAIRWFVRRYQVDLQEALVTSPEEFACFGDFFTRALAPGRRPMPEQLSVVVSPVDGRISQSGLVRDGLLLQAKGVEYPLQALLGGDDELANRFSGGQFMTIYLSPRDYHRVHMPLSGRLRGMTYVPGRMFSVNDASTAMVPGLFTRNERVVAWFDTVIGPVAMVLVGAMCVSAIEMSWFGRITVDRRSGLCRWTYPGEGEGAVALSRGDEAGRFGMGSTVILILPPGRVELDPELIAGRAVRLGEQLGTLQLAGPL